VDAFQHNIIAGADISSDYGAVASTLERHALAAGFVRAVAALHFYGMSHDNSPLG